MPACALEDESDGSLNLSYLASEEAWLSARDSDSRRTTPAVLWLGIVPCACIQQAMSALSLQASPMPPTWPPFIELPFLSLQRVPCVDTALSVGRLWANGAQGELIWAYLPAFAFLKQFPAHSPMIVPPGYLDELAYSKPPGRAANLDFGRLPPTPHATPLNQLIPALHPPPKLLPGSSCGVNGCHGVGWCDGSLSSSPPRCRCAKRMMGRSGLRALRRGSLNEPFGLGNGAEKDNCGDGLDGGGRGRRRRSFRDVRVGGAVSAAHSIRRRGRRGVPGEVTPIHAGTSDDPDWFGPDRWRQSLDPATTIKPCPNECSKRGLGGRCEYGFCHCTIGSWGVDCGLSIAFASADSSLAASKPRVYVYPLPPGLRRSCNWWHLPEDVGDRLLRSEYVEVDPFKADLFWVYGCPNGDMILPTIRWIQRAHPHWNASVIAGRPRHALVVGHEEGWAEVWRYLVHWLRGPSGDHANKQHAWDELHPASPTRQLAILQLSGRSDYAAEGQRYPIRCVSSDAPCYVCFQPSKDVMIPGQPGLVDYPAGGVCNDLADLKAFDDGASASVGVPLPRRGSPTLLFGGAVWTIPQGPGLFEASRLVPYLCHKNASRRSHGHLDYLLVQTEVQPESVHPWQIEQRIDLLEIARHATYCLVPEGKAGGYGHRAIAYLMLGCVPIFTKERFSYAFFDSALNWSAISVHVPPAEIPKLPTILSRIDPNLLRRAAASIRRRLLWASIYGACHLRGRSAGGTSDAFDTLMAVLATPRRHFAISDDHREPRAPDRHEDLAAWLRQRGGAYCVDWGV